MKGKLSMRKTSQSLTNESQSVNSGNGEEVFKNLLPEDLQDLSLMGLMQHGSQALLKQAIMEEITAYLGRGYYRHLKEGQEFRGERNGSRQTTIDTPIGPLVYARPQLAYAPDFQSRFHVPYMRRPEAFADSVADMHVNGVSTRNVKKSLQAVAGKKIRMSKSTVSRITKRLREEFKAWKKRDLSDLPVVYLFLDAIRIHMRLEATPKDAVMIAYAVLEDGSFETISIALKNSESEMAWKSFVGDLKARGLRDPLLTVSDGNHGVIQAIEDCFPSSWRQRCVMHKVDNILETVPKESQEDVRQDLNRIFYGATSLEQAKIAIEDFKKKYKKIYPSAVECLERDLDQCLTFYLFPSGHWRRIRTSNRLERMNLEIRRRLNSIGRHPSEEGCLSLVYQICKRYAQNKKGFKADDLVRALWKRLREKKKEMIAQLELESQAA
jgi:transposase-like protein